MLAASTSLDERAERRPFDPPARRRARLRAARLIAGRAQILDHARTELLARRDLLAGLPQGPTLAIGCLGDAPPADLLCDCAALAPAGAQPLIVAEEDRLPLAGRSFATILSLMTLHGVNDVPGALILARRALLAGGAFLAVLPAGRSGIELRSAFLAADAASGRGVSPRIGPTIDCAQAAGLLQRAGFVDPVAEVETLTLRYGTLADAARDIRAHGGSGWLTARPRALTTPRRWALAEAAFAQGRPPGARTPVTLELLYLAGRAP